MGCCESRNNVELKHEEIDDEPDPINRRTLIRLSRTNSSALNSTQAVDLLENKVSLTSLVELSVRGEHLLDLEMHHKSGFHADH